MKPFEPIFSGLVQIKETIKSEPRKIFVASGLRECSNCTACCKTHAIIELGKQAGVWCDECEVGKGCKIYGKHPQSCTEFKCQWLMGEGSDEDKPNKINIVSDVVEIPVIGSTYMIYEVTKGALNEGSFVETQTLIKINQGMSVCHLPLKGKNTLFIPKNKEIPEGISIFIDNKKTKIKRL